VGDAAGTPRLLLFCCHSEAKVFRRQPVRLDCVSDSRDDSGNLILQDSLCLHFELGNLGLDVRIGLHMGSFALLPLLHSREGASWVLGTLHPARQPQRDHREHDQDHQAGDVRDHEFNFQHPVRAR
jgi:hypothetical protein